MKRTKRTKTKRQSRPRYRYEDMFWSQFLLDPDIRDPKTESGRQFRRRFRVPYDVYVAILNWARREAIMMPPDEMPFQFP